MFSSSSFLSFVKLKHRIESHNRRAIASFFPHQTKGICTIPCDKDTRRRRATLVGIGCFICYLVDALVQIALNPLFVAVILYIYFHKV